MVTDETFYLPVSCLLGDAAYGMSSLKGIWCNAAAIIHQLCSHEAQVLGQQSLHSFLSLQVLLSADLDFDHPESNRDISRLQGTKPKVRQAGYQVVI